MKFNQTLTLEQQGMVEQNTALIHWIIRKYIDVNENVCGLGYDDLYQEGALALCHAAATYLPGRTQFVNYAVTVTLNHLTDYCRRITLQLRNSPTCSLDSSPRDGKLHIFKESKITKDETERWISKIFLSQLLEHGNRQYRGVAKLGIEAMELKIKGYSGVDIAHLYHTKPTYVGAWISRASKKLRQDAMKARLLSTKYFKNTA